jgi:hypothetical protein
MTPSSREMFGRLLKAPNRSRSAKTVEVFGWLILIEGSLMLLAPRLAESVLQLPAFVEQGEHYFRLVGLLTGGLGMLYVVSGRLNSREFVFASMLDRPLVPHGGAVVPQHPAGAAGARLFPAGFREFLMDSADVEG